RLPSHLPLLKAQRTDDLEAVFLLVLLLLIGLHRPLDVLDPVLKGQHAPEARFVMLHPTPRTSHDPDEPLFFGPKAAVADRARCRKFRGITHADLQRRNRLAYSFLGHTQMLLFHGPRP